MTILNTSALPTRKRYKIAREVAGFSQNELANIIGVSRTTVGEWESGRTEPAFSKLVALASATKQPLDWFAEGLEVESRARRDSNPQPSDWEYRKARTAFTRVLVALSLCQLVLDGESHHNGVVQ